MTVSTLTDKVAYTGDGSTTAFSIPYPFFKSNPTVSPEVDPSIKVYLRVVTTGVETLQTYTTHYTVTIDAGDEPQEGDVSMVTAPATTQELHIRRDTQLTQPQIYPTGGSFPSVAHEKALDFEALKAIDAQEIIGRSLSLPVTDPTPSELPNSVDRAGKFLAFGDSGELIIATDAVPSAVSDFMTPVLEATTEGTAKTLLEISDEPNRIYNPCGEFTQRGLTISDTFNDLDYSLDGWKVLSDGNAALWAVKQNIVSPLMPLAGASNAIGVHPQIANKKHGLLQVIDASSTAAIVASGAAEIGFSQWYTTVSPAPLEMYLLKWTGTADAPTADPISAWNGDGTDPTFVANWEVVLEANISQTGTQWDRYTFTTSTSITDATNLAFFWGAINNFRTGGGGSSSNPYYLSLVTVKPAGCSTFMVQPAYDTELLRCQRTYWKTFPAATKPADSTGQAGALHTVGTTIFSRENFVFNVRNPVPMLKTPTVTIFNADSSGGTAARAYNIEDDTTTAVTVNSISTLGCEIVPTTPVTGDEDDRIAVHCVVKVEL